jgi:hypothetical protein
MNQVIKLATASETSPTVKLMDELREVIHKTDYDHITIAALVGILEMLKFEQLQRNME